MMSAPSASIWRAWARACATRLCCPPSEKLSGVTLRMPITSGVGPRTRGGRFGRERLWVECITASEWPDEHQHGDGDQHHDDRERCAEAPVVAEFIAARTHDQRVALMANGGEEVATGADGHRQQEGFGTIAQAGGEAGGNRRHHQHGGGIVEEGRDGHGSNQDRKSTRLNSSHVRISYAVFCLKKKKNKY